jgi:hypothetical protein
MRGVYARRRALPQPAISNHLLSLTHFKFARGGYDVSRFPTLSNGLTRCRY